MDTISSLHSMLPDGETVPEWVHLVPGGTFSGRDGRGPYNLADPQAVITASFARDAKLVIDQDHATDFALRNGTPAPGRGWIVEMQARVDGIWGRVEWTDEGKRLLTERSYRGFSPTFQHDKATGRVSRVLRAALTNAPNLDLTALHSQQDTGMDLIGQLRAALGLPDTADAPAVVAAATAARQAIAGHAQQIARIAAAAKLADTLDADGIVTSLQARGAGAGTLEEVTALQTRIGELEQRERRAAATAAIDAAMRAGKPILGTRREEFVARHMQDPAGTDRWLADMPSLNTGGLGAGRLPTPPAGQSGLAPDEMQVVALMGLDPVAFAKAKAAEAIAMGA